jgi:putative transposase
VHLTKFILLTLDHLISKKSKLKKSKSKIINGKVIKLRKRIKNLQKEIHDKTINWLTTNYNSIVIPKFDSKGMSNKKSRKISTKTVRGMSSLAHGLFLEKLKTKAIENSSKIIIIDEMYTTMTCGKCFYKNRNIKSKSEWICPRCNWHHDRDTNASRNMLIMKQFEEVW